MPVLFALAASLPVIILSMLISTAMQTVRRFEHMSAHFQRWINIITGVIFLVIALSL
jgi:cytochrome c biogenesis protein CcdA